MLPAPSGETAHHRHSVHREPVGENGDGERSLRSGPAASPRSWISVQCCHRNPDHGITV